MQFIFDLLSGFAVTYVNTCICWQHNAQQWPNTYLRVYFYSNQTEFNCQQVQRDQLNVLLFLFKEFMIGMIFLIFTLLTGKASLGSFCFACGLALRGFYASSLDFLFSENFKNDLTLL